MLEVLHRREESWPAGKEGVAPAVETSGGGGVVPPPRGRGGGEERDRGGSPRRGRGWRSLGLLLLRRGSWRRRLVEAAAARVGEGVARGWGYI